MSSKLGASIRQQERGVRPEQEPLGQRSGLAGLGIPRLLSEYHQWARGRAKFTARVCCCCLCVCTGTRFKCWVFSLYTLHKGWRTMRKASGLQQKENDSLRLLLKYLPHTNMCAAAADNATYPRFAWEQTFPDLPKKVVLCWNFRVESSLKSSFHSFLFLLIQREFQLRLSTYKKTKRPQEVLHSSNYSHYR